MTDDMIKDFITFVMTGIASVFVVWLLVIVVIDYIKNKRNKK